MDKAVMILEKHGAKNIEGYTLVSNHGYTFELNGKKYDARYWANSYGCAINAWEVSSMERRKDDPRFNEPVDPTLKKELESALNKGGVA